MSACRNQHPLFAYTTAALHLPLLRAPSGAPLSKPPERFPVVVFVVARTLGPAYLCFPQCIDKDI